MASWMVYCFMVRALSAAAVPTLAEANSGQRPAAAAALPVVCAIRPPPIRSRPRTPRRFIGHATCQRHATLPKLSLAYLPGEQRETAPAKGDQPTPSRTNISCSRQREYRRDQSKARNSRTYHIHPAIHTGLASHLDHAIAIHLLPEHHLRQPVFPGPKAMRRGCFKTTLNTNVSFKSQRTGNNRPAIS